MRAATARLDHADAPVRPGFDEVYRDHVGFVWRSLRRFGVPEAELEDAAHEVFLVVHRRLTEFDGHAAITTWLFAIARGVASNRRRGDARRKRRLEQLDEPPPVVDPGAQLERRDAAEAVARFLAALPDDQRVVFELFEIEGLRAPEIAAALGVNANTIYTRLRAARLRFRDHVAALAAERGGHHG